MDSLAIYKKRLRELEEDALVKEYLYVKKLISLAETPEYNVRVNSPQAVIPERITKLDELEEDENNEILKLIRWAGKACSVNDLNKFYKEFYFEDKDLKYKIRHQFKSGNIYVIRFNKSRKYSFYIAPEWFNNGKVDKRYLPNKKHMPRVIENINVKSFDKKINKEML